MLTCIAVLLICYIQIKEIYLFSFKKFVCIYGAQNEAYMSRSAEKWVRGLCFSELGACN